MFCCLRRIESEMNVWGITFTLNNRIGPPTFDFRSDFNQINLKIRISFNHSQSSKTDQRFNFECSYPISYTQTRTPIARARDNITTGRRSTFA